MSDKNPKNKILTIPNILSFVRIGLIPFIVWLYLAKERYEAALFVLIASGLTDVVDGFIARHFNMISDFGKIIDPIADKLTQASVLFCLVFRFEYMLIPLILLVVKEIYAGITGLITVRITGKVMSSLWHGKLATVLLYFTMALHMIWFDIPYTVSLVLIALCSAAMLASTVMYDIRNKRALKEQKKTA